MNSSAMNHGTTTPNDKQRSDESSPAVRTNTSSHYPNSNSQVVRSRLLAMIMENEQKRHGDVSTPVVHR